MTGRATRRALAGAALLAATPGVTFAIDTTAVWTFDGNQASAHVGYSVAAAGDVNGDGFADLLAAARSYNAGQTNEGRAHLFLGGPAGPSLGFDWTAEGDQNFAFLGTSVAPAGDVNGDGFGDVIVGVRAWDGAVGDGVRFAPEEQTRLNQGPRRTRVVQDHAVYAGMVERMDAGIGVLLDAVERSDASGSTVAFN